MKAFRKASEKSFNFMGILTHTITIVASYPTPFVHSGTSERPLNIMSCLAGLARFNQSHFHARAHVSFACTVVFKTAAFWDMLPLSECLSMPFCQLWQNTILAYHQWTCGAQKTTYSAVDETAVSTCR